MNTFVDEIEKRMHYHKEAIHEIAGDPDLELMEKDITPNELIHELEENVDTVDAQCGISYHAGSIGALLFVADLLGMEYPKYESYCDIFEFE